MHKLVVIALLLALASTQRALADCQVHGGDHVVLYGTSDDPDVFVWDSRFRMRSYQSGSFDQAQQLLPHAMLAPPGTRAIVSSCANNFVQLKYTSTNDDAVGITIVSGPLRGKRGWVLGSDIRGIYRRYSNGHVPTRR
jgi:hypothetical protein